MTIIPIRPRRRRRRHHRHRLLFFARRKVSDDTVLDFIPFFVFPHIFWTLRRLPLAFSERADGTNFEENVFTARRDESAEALSEGFKREYY